MSLKTVAADGNIREKYILYIWPESRSIGVKKEENWTREREYPKLSM